MRFFLYSSGEAWRSGPLVALAAVLATTTALAQAVPPARVAILLAEGRGAKDARDLATLRTGARSADGETARAAVRALGRLGRPALVTDIAGALRSSLPELRAEAANAIASAVAEQKPVAGVTSLAATKAMATTIASALSTLLLRLNVEAEPTVRGAICEAIGRLPFTDIPQMARVEAELVSRARSEVVGDRLGAVKGLESLLRLGTGRLVPSPATEITLRELVGLVEATSDPIARGVSATVTVPGAPAASTPSSPAGSVASHAVVTHSSTAPPHDARIRRLAFQSLLTVGKVDDAVVSRGAADSDPQVRWLAVRAAGTVPSLDVGIAAAVLQRAVSDAQPMIRMEALRSVGLRQKGAPVACESFVEASKDPDLPVALVALDQLGDCAADSGAMAVLDHALHATSDSVPVSGLTTPQDSAASRAWQRQAHALVALSRAMPEQARPWVEPFMASTTFGLRVAAATAAAVLRDREMLERLSSDPSDRIARIGLEALGRAPATPSGGSADPSRGSQDSIDLTAANLQRFAAPRARVVVRDVGTLEFALFTAEAPATVLRFIRLAEEGRFDGTVVGSGPSTTVNVIPAAGQSPSDPTVNETGSWPHVRGALGFSSADFGAAVGGAQVFVDLVDNPQFDHQYAVFAQILNGADILDQILDGDVIERVEILAGP